jgi:hypothetical protein
VAAPYMLDLQRRRQSPRSAPAIIFTRALIAAHLGLAAVAAVFMLAHHLFFHCICIIGWMLLSWVPVWLMMNNHQIGRILWGLFMTAGMVGSLFVLMWQLPTMDRDAAAFLTRRVLPFWLTLYAAAYGGIALLALTSRRIYRATEKGFSILETPDSQYGP